MLISTCIPQISIRSDMLSMVRAGLVLGSSDLVADIPTDHHSTKKGPQTSIWILLDIVGVADARLKF